jgi:hypothetical protein
MTNYKIKVFPKVGEPFVNTYENAERFSIAINAYRMCNIRIECDYSLSVPVNTRLPRNYNYAGD